MPTLAEIVRAHLADYQAQHSLSFLERHTIEALLAAVPGPRLHSLSVCRLRSSAFYPSLLRQPPLPSMPAA